MKNKSLNRFTDSLFGVNNIDYVKAFAESDKESEEEAEMEGEKE